MSEENKNLNEAEKSTLDVADISTVSYNTVWEPTPLIRWEIIEINNLQHKVLQQLWRGGNGEEEWRNVPEHY